MTRIYQYSLFLILGCLFCLASCDERTSGIAGDITVEGVVTIDDTVSNGTIPVAGVEVRFGVNPKNPDRYILKINTDAQGFFRFDNLFLDRTDTAMLSATYVLKAKGYQRHYKDSILFFPGEFDAKSLSLQTLRLEPNKTLGDYFLRLTCRYNDIFSGSDLVAPLTSVRIFSLTDSINETRVLSSNSGIVDFSRLKQGTYRVYASYTQNIESAVIQYFLKTDVTLSGDNKEIFRELILKPSPVPRALVNFVNADGITPQPKASYCLYTNVHFFKNSECNSSNRSGTANSEGKVLLNDLTVGAKYYIAAYDSIGNNLGITGRDSILVTEKITTKKTILLNK